MTIQNAIRTTAKEMEVLLKSRGYDIKSVFGMYLEETAMLVIKGSVDSLKKVARDFSLIKDIHSIELVQELCYDDFDFCDENYQAPLVYVLKCQINYKD
ncbi:hypothetical protein ZPAH1_orf00410 [Aeromonas phage ZPAH1]|nr:hypothetical protein ZPAH1_orf00410 [Aeromonas phage ZPAH1]